MFHCSPELQNEVQLLTWLLFTHPLQMFPLGSTKLLTTFWLRPLVRLGLCTYWVLCFGSTSSSPVLSASPPGDDFCWRSWPPWLLQDRPTSAPSTSFPPGTSALHRGDVFAGLGQTVSRSSKTELLVCVGWLTHKGNECRPLTESRKRRPEGDRGRRGRASVVEGADAPSCPARHRPAEVSGVATLPMAGASQSLTCPSPCGRWPQAAGLGRLWICPGWLTCSRSDCLLSPESYLCIQGWEGSLGTPTGFSYELLGRPHSPRAVRPSITCSVCHYVLPGRYVKGARLTPPQHKSSDLFGLFCILAFCNFYSGKSVCCSENLV